MVTDICLTLLIPFLVLVYLYFAPFTKVEESFNIQAVHDVLKYGVPWDRVLSLDLDHGLNPLYDHVTFTGPVPRTFTGALALAGASRPLTWLNEAFELGVNSQTTVRAVLGLFNACCLIYFRNGVAKAFGKNAARWYALFQASQFHVMYYASRTLPNFFAFGLTTIALRNLLPLAGRSPASRSSRSRQKFALTVLTFTGTVFRSEIAILLGFHTIYLYLRPHIHLSLLSIIPAGLVGVAIGLLITVPIDTFFWQSSTPLWPEFASFTYNILHGRSSDWGTQPWHFYVTSALPRLLFNPIIYQVCIPFALLIPILRPQALEILIPNMLFVVLYSFQPHKEWRFIVYTIPPLLAVASAGASWIWTRRAKSFFYRVLSLSLLASTIASFAASGGMLIVSRLNYPGAVALSRLHSMAGWRPGLVRVHMDTLACITGVTRFMELPPPAMEEDGPFWVYDKTEDKQKLLDPLFWARFEYAIVERPERVIGKWEVLDDVEGFAGIGLLKPGEEEIEAQNYGFGEQEALELIRRVIRDRGLTKNDALVSEIYLESLVTRAERFLRRRITKGWWLKMKMEPRLRILKRQVGDNEIPDG